MDLSTQEVISYVTTVDSLVMSKMNAGSPRLFVMGVERRDTSRLIVRTNPQKVGLTKEELDQEVVEDFQG